MSSLSPEVDGAETVVRVVKSPYHLNKSKKRLIKRAFHPPRGESEFSVIRQLMGDDYCKDKGVDIMKDEHGANYLGLASGLVRFIREKGGDVVDKPKEFEGHAHVVNLHAHVAPADEAVPAEQLEALDAYYEALVGHFDYHPDPAPGSEGWSGAALRRSA